MGAILHLTLKITEEIDPRGSRIDITESWQGYDLTTM